MFGFEIELPAVWDIAEGGAQFNEPILAAAGELGVPRASVSLLIPTALGIAKEHGAQALDALKADEPIVLDEGEITLDDGTEAYGYTLEFPGELPLRSLLYIIPRGSQVFQVFVESVPADFEARSNELEEIAKSFRLREQTPFGVNLAEALVTRDITPATLDPHLVEDIGSYRYASQVFGGLVTLTRDLEVVPDIAASWDVSPDGLVYDFHLDPEAVFHSGKPVTPEDVKWSFERAADPLTGSRVAETYLGDIAGVTEKLNGDSDEIAGVEVVGENTVRFSLTAPVPYFLAKMSHTAGFIINRQNVEDGGSLWFFTPDGTGPFKVRGWEPNVVMVLERHKRYHLGVPSLQKWVAWHFGPDPLLMYEAGDVDVTFLVGDAARKVQNPSHHLSDELQIVSTLGVDYLGFNSQEAPFEDPRARRALALSINLDQVLSDLSNTVERPLGFIPRGMPGFSDSTRPISFDPTEAKRLWSEVVNETGVDLTEIRFQVQGLFVPSYVRLIAEMWNEHLGLETVFHGSLGGDLGTLLRDTSSHVFEFGWIADYPDPHNFLDVLFHSNARWNTGLYSNDRVDSLLEGARINQNYDDRLATYDEVNQLMLDDTAGVPLWYFRRYILVKPHVVGWFFSAQELWDVTEITLMKEIQV